MRARAGAVTAGSLSESPSGRRHTWKAIALSAVRLASELLRFARRESGSARSWADTSQARRERRTTLRSLRVRLNELVDDTEDLDSEEERSADEEDG